MAGLHYDASASAERPKFVACEKCRHKYGYWMQRTGTGGFNAFMGIGMGSYGEQRAAEKAQSDLESQLGREVDVVPCPECGHIQKKMVEKARDEHFAWIRIAGFVAIPVGLVLFKFAFSWVGQPVKRMLGLEKAHMLSNIVVGICVLLICCAPFWAMLIKDWVKKTYNPNAEPKKDRIRQGRELAMSKNEHARLTGGECETKLHHKARFEDQI